MKRDVIFILEDVARITYSIRNALHNRLGEKFCEFLIIECTNLSDANDEYDEYKDRIACLICDSNMIPTGLRTNELKTQSFNGLFAGWLWFIDKVQQGDTALLGRTIFYTAYYDDLVNFIKSCIICDYSFNHVSVIQKRTVLSIERDELINKVIELIME